MADMTGRIAEDFSCRICGASLTASDGETAEELALLRSQLRAAQAEVERLTAINERQNVSILELQEMVSSEEACANERGVELSRLRAQLARAREEPT